MLRSTPLQILFLEPFNGGSHRAFARGWAAHSRHCVTVKTLPPRFWKWRLRGAAFSFAEKLGTQARRDPGLPSGIRGRSPQGKFGRDRTYDVVVATSMMNAADFRAAARLDASIPLIVYFHENQLSYPRPPDEPLDHGLALASLSSAAAADAVVFNSRFHREEFFRGLADWLKMFPEFEPRKTAAAIRKRSSVISPGIDWEILAPLSERGTDVGASGAPASSTLSLSGSLTPPLILWNHRWEFDKNPRAFFSAIEVLASRGWRFRLALLGENTQFVPKPFLAARERFGPHIVQFGYVKSDAAYRRWLGQADIVVSTARQENFGIAVTEAVAAGAFPLLPARLSYPEILASAHHGECLYRGQAELVRKLERLLAHPGRIAEGRRARSLSMRRYDWSRIAPRLDDLAGRLTGRSQGVRPLT